MTIGRVAKAAGVAPSTIRYYEEVGVIAKPARRNGVRDYDPSVVERLKIVRFYRSSGISIRILAALAESHGDERRTRRRAIAEDRIADLEAMIADAQRAKHLLEEALACRCRGNPRACTMLLAVEAMDADHVA
jgi:MerR family redox-sensitive transcriptional activator SoxR